MEKYKIEKDKYDLDKISEEIEKIISKYDQNANLMHVARNYLLATLSIKRQFKNKELVKQRCKNLTDFIDKKINLKELEKIHERETEIMRDEIEAFGNILEISEDSYEQIGKNILDKIKKR